MSRSQIINFRSAQTDSVVKCNVVGCTVQYSTVVVVLVYFKISTIHVDDICNMGNTYYCVSSTRLK